MGFLKDIEDMPNQFEYSKTFFARWYRPEYATVIVAGDVNPEAAFRLVEKYFGGWKRGTHSVTVPAEPPAEGPVYAHVPWSSDTLPWVTVAFHGPAFSETKKDLPAIDTLFDLSFGPTSDLYKRLVEQEQKLDAASSRTSGSPRTPSSSPWPPGSRRAPTAVYIRDEILKTLAGLRDAPVDRKLLEEAKSNARYGLARTLDNTETIASTLARFVRLRRSYGTLNAYYRLGETLTPADLLAAARTYLTDANLVVTTLSREPMPEAMATTPGLARFESVAKSATVGPELAIVTQPSPLPRLDVKLLFTAGSAHDPKGKEGLAALTARMIAQAGSKDRRIDEIRKALFPMAGSFDAQVDREMTTFTGVIHKDNWEAFFDMVLPQLTDPGFREEDFRRLKDAQMNALVQNLRNNNEEELGKERLQELVYRGTPYGHPVLGTVVGDQRDHARRREGLREEGLHARRAHGRRRRATRRTALLRALKAEAGKLAAGPALPTPEGVSGRKPNGRRGRHREEGDPRHGDLLRLPDRRHARPSGLRGALRRAGLARRAPLVQLAPLPAHPRGARHELRRLRVHRGVPARHVPVLPGRGPRAPRPALRDLDPARRAPERAHGAPHRDPRAGPPRERRASPRRSSRRRATTS